MVQQSVEVSMNVGVKKLIHFVGWESGSLQATFGRGQMFV